jgi:nitric oxide reductase NorD protein
MGGMKEKLEFELWEPEESVGKFWHALAEKLDAPAEFEDEAVTLDEMHGRLTVLFRGLGGTPDVEIKPAPVQESQHRLSRRRALGKSAERLAHPSFDGEALRLPSQLAVFPHRHANAGLYLWLAAAAAFAEWPLPDSDPLRANIRALQAAQRMTEATLAECPGLRRLHASLSIATRKTRRQRSLPAFEAAIESAILHLLGAPPPSDPLTRTIVKIVRVNSDDLDAITAPRGYRSFMPVPIWLDLRSAADRQRVMRDEETPEHGQPPQDENERTFKASRKSADEAARKDSLILHKFEAILSWTEFLNLNRRTEDDDEDTAKKAADDQEEITLTRVPQRARTRIRLHLDLSPEEADFERLAGKHVYSEWDHRKKAYMPDYCRVLSGSAQPAGEEPAFLACPKTLQRIRSVRRQFEVLRPRRVHLNRQVDGEEIDIEAAVAARIELVATGEHSDRVYRASRAQERDLAVSILLDASRSTESIVGGRAVIDIAKEALIALSWGLDACGEETSIDAFSSLRRDRVFVSTCKQFSESMSPRIEARIAGLKPGHYTRLGAAIRHVSSGLAQRSRQRRLLMVLTDGKPNDLDHYEGRYGIEDTHMAVREARRNGQSVFGITIDRKARAPFARIFGRGGFAVIPDPEKLTAALPQIYSHLVGGS